DAVMIAFARSGVIHSGRYCIRVSGPDSASARASSVTGDRNSGTGISVLLSSVVIVDPFTCHALSGAAEMINLLAAAPDTSTLCETGQVRIDRSDTRGSDR